MAEKTGISWCDATFNPWMGCTKVSPACDNCYAEKLVTGRMGKDLWGASKPRHRTSESNWKKARQWNKTPNVLIGSQWPSRKPRVFAASLADIFDNEIDQAWRDDFWALVRETPNLQWLIVTKRIGNAAKMLPADWGDGYPNVTLLITVADQEEAARDIWKLLTTPAARRGLSIEPMLGQIDPTDLCNGWFFYDAIAGCRWHDAPANGPAGASESTAKIDWVICGGESGKDARPMHPEWARLLRDQCAKANVPFHFKQWGEWAPLKGLLSEAPDHVGVHVWQPGYPGSASIRIGKVKAGRLLDGVEHNEFPVAA